MLLHLLKLHCVFDSHTLAFNILLLDFYLLLLLDRIFLLTLNVLLVNGSHLHLWNHAHLHLLLQTTLSILLFVLLHCLTHDHVLILHLILLFTRICHLRHWIGLSFIDHFNLLLQLSDLLLLHIDLGLLLNILFEVLLIFLVIWLTLWLSLCRLTLSKLLLLRHHDCLLILLVHNRIMLWHLLNLSFRVCLLVLIHLLLFILHHKLLSLRCRL